jgi:small subunit ribosomal protein S8
MYHIADFILRIKNAYMARRKTVVMPYANVTKAIAKTLIRHGFIAGVTEEEVNGHRSLVVTLRYENRKPVLQGVKIVSKPSLRVYKPAKDIVLAHEKSSTSIISTSQGVLTGKEAVQKGVGGELLFKVW